MQDRIKQVMSDVLSVPDTAITSDTSQVTLRQWDSLGHMNLCMALEEEFGVKLTDRQVVKMTSFREIVHILEGIGTP